MGKANRVETSTNQAAMTPDYLDQRWKLFLIPFAKNKDIFERVKAPKIEDRKRHCIVLILCRLRSSICRWLSRG